MSNKWICRLMIMALSFSATVSAQQGAGQNQTKPAPQGPTVKVNTELVEVRAVVTDKQGNIIGGLKPEDFELLEDGKPQTVSFFSIARIAGNDNRASTPTAPTTSNTPPPSTIRERLGEAPARTIVLFADNLHFSASSLLQVKQTLRRFVDEQLTEQDLVALVSTAGNLGLVEQFTRNRQVLRYAIERLSPGPGFRESLFTPYLAAQVQRNNHEALDLAIEIIKQEEFFIGDRRTLENFAHARASQVLAEISYQRKSSLLTLKAVAERMAGLPGQRMIALLSDGFSLYDSHGTPETDDLQATISRAVRSGVAIYSINPKGLQPPSLFSAATGGAITNPRLHSYQSAAERDLENGLNALAKDTGGEVFFNTNDLRGALQKVLESNRLYYVLAYYPSDERESKQFRRLTIRVKGHPEYTVHTPKGYMLTDVAKNKKEAEVTPQQRLAQAMFAPLPQNEIRVSAAADFIEGESDQAQVSLTVHIAGDKLTYREQDQKHLMNLELVTMIFDASGKRVDLKAEALQANLTPEHLALAQKNGYSYARRVALKPGLYQARIGVREINTEHIGTATAWVEVLNLARSKLALSSLVLLDVLNKEGAKSSETKSSELSSRHVVEGIKFYAQGQFCIYFFRIYQSVQTSPEALLMRTEFLTDGRPIAQSDWQSVSARQIVKDKKGIGAGAQIQLAGLKPGIYELRVTVKDPVSKRTVQRTAAFGVE